MISFILASETFVRNPEGSFKYLKQLRTQPAVSLRVVWFELVQSLAMFDFSFLLCAKLNWASNVKRKTIGYTYDPETNLHDAVSSNEKQ